MARIKRRSRRMSSSYRFYICVIAVLLLFIICGIGTILLYKKQAVGPVASADVDLNRIDSPCAILLNGDSGEVIASKYGEEYIFPASMVKIMSVYTAITKISDLNQRVTMSDSFYPTLWERDAYIAGYEPGEEAVVKDLLYGALLPSGAECCMELAIVACGSEDALVEEMNRLASEWGMDHTHFVNCTGLHNDDQYSTPKEIGMILKRAMENDVFRKVFTTESYTVSASDIHPNGFTVQSSMFKALNGTIIGNCTFLGGKTGYTDEAGFCLASMAKISNTPYILVTAGWPDEASTSQYHINDALLVYGQIATAGKNE